jgi:hypothetical protein
MKVPWKTWGPTNSRILERDSITWGGLSAERHAAAVLMSRIMIRDYNPYRVRHALALLGVAGREVTLACGSVVKVVKEASIHPGGFFHDDIETSLPYVETVTSYDGCRDVSMEDNYLVAEVITTVSHVRVLMH